MRQLLGNGTGHDGLRWYRFSFVVPWRGCGSTTEGKRWTWPSCI